jgi:hypothetical protein
MPRHRKQARPATEIPADPLERALAAVVADARAQVRAGRAPDRKMLDARVRGAAERRRAELVSQEALEDARRAERAALQQLERLTAVHRAFRRVAQPIAAPPPSSGPTGSGAPRRFGGFKVKPTVSGTLDVRKASEDGGVVLRWDPVPAVKSWEVRFARKADARSDWAPEEPVVLAPGATHVVLPLDDRPLRVSIVGQARDGRPVRRLLVSQLTAENWEDRWERRATAS